MGHVAEMMIITVFINFITFIKSLCIDGLTLNPNHYIFHYLYLDFHPKKYRRIILDKITLIPLFY
jgi:hypothetical protein